MLFSSWYWGGEILCKASNLTPSLSHVLLPETSNLLERQARDGSAKYREWQGRRTAISLTVTWRRAPGQPATKQCAGLHIRPTRLVAASLRQMQASTARPEELPHLCCTSIPNLVCSKHQTCSSHAHATRFFEAVMSKLTMDSASMKSIKTHEAGPQALPLDRV